MSEQNKLTQVGRGTLFSLYPWNDFPPDGQSYDYTAVVATPGVGVETVVLETPVPVGWDGCVLRIANCYLGPAGSLDYSIPSLTWRIRIDQRLAAGYSAITTEFGSTQQPRPISPILVSSGQVLRYYVTNNDAGLPTVGTFIFANFSGHFWPHRTN